MMSAVVTHGFAVLWLPILMAVWVLIENADD